MKYSNNYDKFDVIWNASKEIHTQREREREQRITNCNGMILEGTTIRRRNFFSTGDCLYTLMGFSGALDEQRFFCLTKIWNR